MKKLKQRLEFEAEVKRPLFSRSTGGVEPRVYGETVAAEKAKDAEGAPRNLPFKPYGLRPPDEVTKSLAILPFINVSEGEEMEYLADGITESLINSLSQLPELRVIARSTMLRYKGKECNPQEIGHNLGVDAVLVGRMRQRVGKLIISTELVDVADGSQLWGEQYNRNLNDVLMVQEVISREISEKLCLKLISKNQRIIGKRYTKSTEAYQEYLKGRYFWNKRTATGLKIAIEHFQRAIEIDPIYALAYSGLADCYNALGWWRVLPIKESFLKAKAAATKALEIDDTLAEAHTSLIYAKLHHDWDWAGAEWESLRALELNPNYATAHHWRAELLVAVGELNEAVSEDEHALELEPLSLIINSGMGAFLYWAREYDKAAYQLQKALEMNPYFPAAHLFLGLNYTQMQRYDDASAEFQQAVIHSENNTLMTASLAHVYAVSGNRDQALQKVNELHERSTKCYVSPFDLAIIYTGLGETEKAFQWLEKAFDERSAWLVFIRAEPRLDSLRADPRFHDLIYRIGLPM